MIKQNKVFLLLGSNIEPRYDFIVIAEKKISNTIGDIIQSSFIYISEPVGFKADISFLNRVLVVNSKLSALSILGNIHIIEKELGRKRELLGYTSRTIDIDILYFNNEIISTNNLTVPHARLHERKFTLIPLTEIAPEIVNPMLNHTNKKLLELCKDDSEVIKYKSR